MKSQNMRLWAEAVPINQARFDLAEPTQVARYKELGEVTLTGELSQRQVGRSPTNPEFLQIMHAAVATTTQANSERLQIERRINQNFTDMIRARELRCFAFEPPRKIDSEPIEMHVEHWTTSPDWTEGAFQANGLSLIELRVVKSHLNEGVTKSDLRRQPGRPSIRRLVEEAFAALSLKGQIDCHAPAVSHFPAIREWIEQSQNSSGIDARNLSNEGIRAHFAPLFRALKEGRKQ